MSSTPQPGSSAMRAISRRATRPMCLPSCLASASIAGSPRVPVPSQRPARSASRRSARERAYSGPSCSMRAIACAPSAKRSSPARGWDSASPASGVRERGRSAGFALERGERRAHAPGDDGERRARELAREVQQQRGIELARGFGPRRPLREQRLLRPARAARARAAPRARRTRGRAGRRAPRKRCSRRSSSGRAGARSSACSSPWPSRPSQRARSAAESTSASSCAHDSASSGFS